MDTDEEFIGKIDKGVVKIQSVWRGYDCRWKNPFLLINEKCEGSCGGCIGCNR